MSHASDLSKDPNTVRITVTEKDGTKHVGVSDATQFSMHTWPTREQLLDKFWDQIDAYGIISHAKAQKAIDLCDKLEDVADMRELTELLMP